MGVGSQGSYPQSTYHQYVSKLHVKFVSAATTGAITVTDGAEMLAAAPVTRTSEGIFVVHLQDDYRAIYVEGLHAELATVDDSCQLSATSVTAGANSVTLRLGAVDGAVDDQVGASVHLTLGLNLGSDA